MEAKAKKIIEIFKEYETKSNIQYAEIVCLNVIKKTNTLEIKIYADEIIEIKEVWFFEKFLLEKFKFSNIELVINYHEMTEKKSIDKEWKNIIAYMSHKYPLAKPMLLLKSNLETENNIIKVKMKIKGAEFLKAKKVDKELQKVIKNIYGIDYVIDIFEDISKEEMKEIQEKQKREEAEIIAKMEKQQISDEVKSEKLEEEFNNMPYMPPVDMEGYIPEENIEDGNINIPTEQEILEQEYILGKPTRVKEKMFKISQITSNDAKVTIEGRLVKSELRETKTGKGMLIFDIYDGTGMINCKSFAKDYEEGKEIIGKLEKAKAIKVTGKPGLDTYLGDISVIANTIIETAVDVPELPKEEETPLIYGNSMNIKEELVKIEDLTTEDGRISLEGEVIFAEDRELKSGKTLFSFDVYDETTTITCKVFLEKEKAKKQMKRITGAKAVKLVGTPQMDSFSDEMVVMINTIVEIEGIKKAKRKDLAEEKRVELHLHTQMSQMDGMSSAKSLIKRAMDWGMKSIAITDHGVVQSFPEAHKMLGYNNPNMKVIYGVEGYLAPDNNKIVTNSKGQNIDTIYSVLDLETTGFSAKNEKITEVGILKIKNGEVIDEFSCFVNPEKHIPARVTEVTNITDDMVKDAETIDKVFPKILDFIKDTVIVAHNAGFDIGFLKQNARNLGYEFDFTYLDTLSLAKQLYPEYKRYKLEKIAENLGIKVEVAHRALDDVKTTVQVFNKMMELLIEKGVKTVDDVDILSSSEETKKEAFKKLNTYHIIILAKNYVGLKNLYKLVSYSHVDYFYRKPRILKSILEKHREGLIIGSACEAGEVFQAIEMGKPEDEIIELAEFYDYLEIQPIGNNDFMIRKGMVPDKETLRDYNRKIVEIGEKLDKKVVATGDVHFLDPQDEIYRRILEAGQGYDDADNQAPLYFKTTDEMLEEFSYLGKEKAYEVVVTNTNEVANMCDQISPISTEKCAPHIPGCEDEIRDIAYEKSKELYGEELPEIVKERLERELDSIISNGFSVMYIIAQKLVWKSNEDGYIVGSRGSVGSSYAAYATGITEVNSLPPHYRCPNCKYSDFSDYGFKNGFDLPDKKCPKCDTDLAKDGMDIPFETFLGFNGDKEPDIDLNFSGEYQAKAHRYTEEIFGKGTTYKAGTIGTIAEKTAFGYVRKYFEERNMIVNVAETKRIAGGCVGIKRTTGQQTGGIIVVPKRREKYEFCPEQQTADKSDSDIVTTHFDYHSIDENLLKLDILGHDDPTIIRMLQDLTGIDPTKVKLDDKETMSIFRSTEALGVTPEQIKSQVGSFGIPEFGTKFVRGMLVDTKPTTFDELIRISGLSHGTDVWLNNAQDLINEGTVTLR